MFCLTQYRARASVAALLLCWVSACSTVQAPTLVSVTPANDSRVDNSVTAVGFAFSGPVKLESLRVSGPRGANSQNQILVADGDIVPLSATFSYPLPVPLTQVGRYWIDFMAWDAKSKTSYSRSYSFGLGSKEQLSAYDIEMVTWDAAQSKTPAPAGEK